MTVTVTPTVQAGNDPPRVMLSIAADAGETAVTVTRLDPDGRGVPVRTYDGGPLVPSGGAGLLYDYEMPLGIGVRYSSAQSPDTVSAEVTVVDPVDDGRVWLVHPGVPALSVPVEFRRDSFDAEEWSVREAVFYPLHSEFPVVQTDGVRRAAEGSFTVGVSSLDDFRALRTLLADASTLLLNVPLLSGLGIDTCYIAVGSVRGSRPSDIGFDPHRDVTFPYRVVGRPAGGSQSERTLADLTSFGTLAALSAAYPTLLAVATGP